jgi:hypothetical protein
MVPSWSEALHFLAGAGAAVAAGVIISVLIEYLPRFQALEQKVKVAVYVGLCVLIPLIATALAIATQTWGSWGDVAGTWWPAVYEGLAAAGFGTLFHAWKPDILRK